MRAIELKIEASYYLPGSEEETPDVGPERRRCRRPAGELQPRRQQRPRPRDRHHFVPRRAPRHGDKPEEKEEEAEVTSVRHSEHARELVVCSRTGPL